MRAITFARALLWTACISGLLIFLFEIEGVRKILNSYLIRRILSIDADQLHEYADDLKKYLDIWQGISSTMVGAGAFLARRYHKANRELNGTWYWVSEMGHNNRLLRLAWGEMTIDGVHDSKKLNNPKQVIYGKVRADSNDPAAANSKFHATEITIAGESSQMLFYDWEYHDGIDIKGATKLKYYFEKSEGGWFRPKARIAMSGRFMVETEEGGGAIEFYKTDNEAIARYQGEVKRIREAA